MSRRSCRRPWPTRFALWVAVCALVLKAAVPMFAAGAAGLRGVAVAEVCPVYGVALRGAQASQHANDNHAHDHAHDHAHHGEHPGHEDHSQHAAASHGGDHCALTALAALAVPDIAAPAIAAPQRVATDLAIERDDAWRDESAAWAARLKHGPPPQA